MTEIGLDNKNAVLDPVPIQAVCWVRQGGNGLDPWDAMVPYYMNP